MNNSANTCFVFGKHFEHPSDSASRESKRSGRWLSIHLEALCFGEELGIRRERWHLPQCSVGQKQPCVLITATYLRIDWCCQETITIAECVFLYMRHRPDYGCHLACEGILAGSHTLSLTKVLMAVDFMMATDVVGTGRATCQWESSTKYT